MGERRSPGVLNQRTLADEPPAIPSSVPPNPLSVDEPSSPVPEAAPRLEVYPPVVPSSTALQERQLRWLRERDRRATSSPTLPVPPDP